MARPRAMRWAAVLQLLGIAGLAWPALGWGPPAAAGVLVVLYFLLYTPAATVLATLMMDHASPESPATDYTVQASLSHFFSMGLSSVGALLAEMCIRDRPRPARPRTARARRARPDGPA